MTTDLQPTIEEIERLISRNARHRSGHRIADVQPAFILEQAKAELDELMAAPDDPMELADTLSILLHYAVRMGWSLADLQVMMISKMRFRFDR